MEDELSEMNQEIITKLQQLCFADALDGISYDWKIRNIGFDDGPRAK